MSVNMTDVKTFALIVTRDHEVIKHQGTGQLVEDRMEETAALNELGLAGFDIYDISHEEGRWGKKTIFRLKRTYQVPE